MGFIHPIGSKMKHGKSQECSIGEADLFNKLQKVLDRLDEQVYGLDTIDKICSSLEWELLPSKTHLDPSWQRPGWWCDGVGFLLLEIPSRNRLRGFGYSYWVDPAGEYNTEPIEVELRLIESDQPPQLDYSIKLWAGGLLHHYTPSGITIAQHFDEHDLEIESYRNELISIITNKNIDIRQRLIAADLLEKFLRPNTLFNYPPFRRLMNDPEADVRRIATSRLATDLPSQMVSPYAIQALKDSDRYVRALAVIALWRSAREDGDVRERLSCEIPLLLEMFTRECSDPSYRKFRFNEAAAEILSLISRKNSDSRAAIFETLEGKGMGLSI